MFEAIRAWWRQFNNFSAEDPFTACPDCGCTEFIDGPTGGVSQNVECSNPNCGSRFNLLLLPGGPYLSERISPPSPKHP